MTEVYLMKLFESSSDVYMKMLDLVCEEKRSKLANIKISENQLQSLTAGVLLRVVLCTYFGFINENIVFERETNGKPYLKNKSVHFNISHSESLVAVAVSDRDVGVDLEKTCEVNPKLTDRYFTENEKKYINVKSPDWQTRFFEVWTKKEAILKKSGLGLRVKLNELETDECNTVKTFKLDGFVLSVCSEDPNINIFNNEYCQTIVYKYFQ